MAAGIAACGPSRPPAEDGDLPIWDALFRRFAQSERSLQVQIRQMIVAGVEDRRIPSDARLPSSRDLARLLGVARNTVVLAYQQLIDEGLLVSRERSGYFIARPDPVGIPRPVGKPSAPGPALPAPSGAPVRQPAGLSARPDWSSRFGFRPSRQRNIVKQRDWLRYPYPFLYGQFDPTLFPTNAWRECARGALSVLEIHNWARDMIDGDDPELIEQLRLHVLPRRGIWARPDEIIVTLGAQHALYLIAELLFDARTRVGMEDPGYPDARNIFRTMAGDVRGLAVDDDGLEITDAIADCDYLYVTAGHQCPTTVTLPKARRDALLALARANDVVVIEDDYETELVPDQRESAALKSLDDDGRVLFIGSLSKILAPGLRLGYLIAPEPVIRELRALRRLMLRHPPTNNQRAAALFLGLGHYKSHVRRVSRALSERADALDGALERHLPGFRWKRGPGTSSAWLEGPPGFDARALATAAEKRGILIEPGDVFFMGEDPPKQFLRLGYSSIPAERIEAGVAALGALVGESRR